MEPGAKTPAAPTLGDGRYVIGRELGRGAMGVVYEAEDTVLARTVAVKTIELAFAPPEPVRKQFEQRFFAEARVAARMAHPGIVVCHDVGKDPSSGKLFIVFEYLKGRTLAARAAEGPMPWRDALAVVVQVARAIHHAHDHGIIHRDLKPANIMLLDARRSAAPAARRDTAAKIMDFGVARFDSLGPRLTGPGQAFGSPLYTSPEQALGESCSARSDIFSLGSVLCTLLLGRPWFDAPSIPEIVHRVVHDSPPRVSTLRPDVPATLDLVVSTALAKREDDRYLTAAEMADDLDEVLAGGTPKYAGAAMSSAARVRPTGHDTLLEGLIAPAGGAGRAPAHDPAAAVASLLDEATRSIRKTEATATIASSAAASSRRRWLAPAGGAIVATVLAALAFVAWPRPAPVQPAPEPTGAPSALPSLKALPPDVFAGAGASPVAPSVPPVTFEAPAVASAPPASIAMAPAVRSTAPPTAEAATVAIEPSPADVAGAGEAASVTSPAGAVPTRMRFSVEHPFENGRLIVWIDGVLAFEEKLRAPVSKKIVAIKVREGRIERLLDVEPGPHEVRVEVTWDQNRRVATKLADAAAGSTGLLEIRVGRMSKDLTLQWSRLAKD